MALLSEYPFVLMKWSETLQPAFLARIGLLLGLFVAPPPLLATVLETSSSTALNGAVLAVRDDTVTFLEQEPQDQPDVIKSGDSDDLFRAQGHRARLRSLPLTGVKSIAGVAPDAFRDMWKSNLLYRVFSEFEAGRILVTTRGTFLEQVRSVVVFLALLFVALPLALVIVSWVLPGERMGALGAVGFVLLLSALGFGVARLSPILAGMGGTFAAPAFHVALNVLFAVVVALFVQWGSRFNFLQGLSFAAVWGAGLFFIARITARLVGFPSLDETV